MSTISLNLPSVGVSGATTPESRRRLWAGRIVTGIPVLFLAFDTTMKVLQLGPAVEGTTQLGYPASAVMPLGVLEIGCLALYLVPRTAALGAVLMTGFLGGAVATHVRMSAPLFSHTLFPLYVGALLWLGLWLRDARVRGLLGRPRV